MKQFWHHVLEFAEETTAHVAVKLLQDFGQVQAEEKSDRSLVTQSDKWADKAIRDAINSTFPDHGILSEETSHIFPDTEWCWVIDPIDGTTNFTRGVPLWGISLALLYQGMPVFGYVYLPPVEQGFHAFYGKALDMKAPDAEAYLNQRVLKPTPDEPSGNHFFNLCSRSTEVIVRSPDFPCKFRMLGAATYNLLTVAAGIAIGAVEATPKIWDIAAVWAIIQASGASWVPLNGETIFPLKPGENYEAKTYPTLAVSRAELIEVFQPLVEFIAQP
ncbi:inositol monophosphatase [Desertifilum sp. FACHB-1129]|uniref:Inositol monophosphatase n=1 Tax=Desertifilum tharense IPPAS B-1220 TaxID=1781255 RepID=A0A1E5QQU6_9CYAN|nr:MULTISPECIES: inositol monophosphatase family protein [Desertifilum]MDA0213468.1 inositol monophosphatase family protein [Cyanobacteria bacterium FC1]MBD2314378.1 inositol monophosphatase [Desertifilum sp. FACHB-1129]MBD2323311.1 inositol monophosphatase [Desertifilum sp. FACHB-866]MBD2333156.1 inositol monophosphatase [Desertifilum sp. FACHB-868]OEJ76984.1 inositol monophosphatase [Desertifilum tharense IPPAS B-1220]